MTRSDVSKIVYIISSLYPFSFKKFAPQEYESMVTAWSAMLSDVAYEDAEAGIKIYAKSDSGFPPSIGQVIEGAERIRKKREIYGILKDMGMEDQIEGNVPKDVLALVDKGGNDGI